MKPLSPTLKEKKRYIVYEVDTGADVSFEEVTKTINESLFELVGLLGCAGAGVIHMKKYWNNQLKRGMLRVNLNYTDCVKSAFLMIKKVGSKTGAVRSVGISGMINQAKDKYLKKVIQ